MTIIFQILGITIGLGFLIFIHELGHFTAAKMCKVRILTFAFGFGPDLIKYIHKGTKYCIKAIPFGGFVAMAGENPEEATGGDGEYLSLKWYKKIWISFAGPFLNYVLAVFMFTLVFNIWGAVKTPMDSSIGAVIKNHPAAIAGLMPGDKIKSIDGVNINTWNDLNDNLKDKADKQISFVIERENHSFELSMTATKNPITGVATIGISPVKTKVGFFKSIHIGIETSIVQTIMPVVYLTGKIKSLEKPDISGPIGIIQIIANTTKSGMQDYLKLIAVISIALGLFNLFPIPMVDGGMILLFLVEGIIRKQISPKVVQVYNTIGLVIIIGILIFATYSDILRLGIGKLFAK
ncbi:RIP metalloprotease [Candidatus Endomicrobiellum agilis]|uniref:M50 family metallopeptidase n=1 Tax=Candidatus Endomicrobiellum agilis TaxID=3238957 RepID=UPI0035832518|nr:M50 family metallopeptidase [Endomicrobium sp.]